MIKTILFVCSAMLILSCSKESTPPVETIDPNASLKEGLVAYYPFNGNVNDESGNNLNGSIVGNVGFSDNRYFESNKCIKLSGGNSYVKVADNPKLQLKQKMSIYMEFMPEENAVATLIGKRENGIGPQAWQLAINYQSPVVFQLIKGGKCSNSNVTSDWSYSFSDTNIPIMKDCWNYLIAIYDGTSQKVYLNGKLAVNLSVNFSEMGACQPSEMRFGYWWTGDPLPFKGKLDEIRIYDRVLTESEMGKLYKLD
jgi:hypothetical protein